MFFRFFAQKIFNIGKNKTSPLFDNKVKVRSKNKMIFDRTFII
ncbi:hypothetical protein HMPREF9065_01171 [Aggregatibacter sp. oral taxon 458 str. W10330]|jgi:hypothetical protein|nr:hypothetical protein HMPREF9065_01171 [Aggregatibacter sp. oral taxon 458 str. W10330]